MDKHANRGNFPEGISQPAIRALAAARFDTLEDLAGASESELLKLHGFGPKAAPIISEALKERDLEPLRP